MRGFSWASLLLAAGLLAACARPASDSTSDLAADEQSIRDRSAEWLKLAQAKDAAGIANNIYAADAATLFDGNIRKGRAEIQSGLEIEVAEMPDATISWTTTDVKVSGSGDLAYERGRFAFDPDGAGAAPEVNGEFVTVWSKVDGKWHAVVDAGTAAKTEAAPATPPATG
ncbi:MAG: YybH family protein [Steroidobacteraceae bacterium]